MIDAPLDLIRIGHAGDTASVIVPNRNALGQTEQGTLIRVPEWVGGERPLVGENGNAYARRPLDEKYGAGNWKTALPPSRT